MLNVENLDLHYGAAQALRSVSLKAELGKVTCVIGRNGVGKTSLCRAITGQQKITRGTLELDGKPIANLAPADRARAGIGFVPQGREIFPLLSVEENLKTGFAPLSVKDRFIPDEIFELFPVLNTMLGRREILAGAGWHGAGLRKIRGRGVDGHPPHPCVVCCRTSRPRRAPSG